jgi:hypothetical protein
MGKKQRIEKMKEDKYQKWKKVHDAEMWKMQDMMYEERRKERLKERDMIFQKMRNARPTGILKLFKSMTVHFVHK